MPICSVCNEKEVYIKKQQLCSSCYFKIYRNSEKYSKPGNKRKAAKIKKVWKKYGVNFLKDMKAVKHKQFQTLQSIGKKYNISRERVRQIFNLIYGEGFSGHRKKKTVDRTTDLNIGCLYDPKRRSIDYENYTAKKHAETVLLFQKECEKHDHKVTFGYENAYDLKVNSNKVFVSYINTFCTPNKKGVRYYSFRIRLKHLASCDFFAAYVCDQDVFYIIPNENKQDTKPKTYYIPEIETDYPASKNKYLEHLNRFDYFNK